MSQEDIDRYLRALHAVQTGVAIEMDDRPLGGPTSPKHLRVGVDSSLCSNAALVNLLIAKGVFTCDEWDKELADETEREVKRYEERLSQEHGATIKLH